MNLQVFDGDTYDLPEGGTRKPSGRLYNISAQDGTAPLFQAGVGFTQRDEGPLLTIGASKTLAQRVGVGLAYKMWVIDQGKYVSGSDAVLSTTYIVESWIQVSAILDNVFKSKAAAARNAPREIIFATKTNVMEIFMVYFDPHWTPDLPEGHVFGHELGLEFPVMKDLFLRAGQFHNAYQPHLYGRADGLGVGVGWVAPKLSLEYGLRRVTKSSEGFGASVAHTFGATIFF